MLVRLALLYVGLAIFGFAIQAMVVADLGVPPWDVFHTGLADRLGWSLGTTTVIVSFVVLLAWIPLRERPGLGTVSNAALVGTFVDIGARVFPDETPDSMVARVAIVVAAIVVNGVATGMYIGARFGPGPRDGLMTSIAKRRWSVRSVRTAIEVTVLLAGVILGGSIGFATVAFAVAIGPIAHHTIPFFTRLAATTPPAAATFVPSAAD